MKESKLYTLLLLATLALYPIKFANHTLYLVPQLSIVLLAVLGGSKYHNHGYSVDRLLVMFGAFFVSFSTIYYVEMLSTAPDLLMFEKVFINCSTIVLIYWSGLTFDLPLMKGGIIIATAIFSIIEFMAHLYGGSTFQSIIITILSSDVVSSEQLYGFASPLEQVFITKNISAMFVVSVFAIYLSIVQLEKKKIDKLHVGVFAISILMFFSRQAVMVFLSMIAIYFYMNSKRVTKAFIVSFFAIIFFFIFISLFDLSSTHDGAGERIVLWKYFFSNVEKFIFSGNGIDSLNKLLLDKFDIDNFHMFFMNQIGAYGVIHFFSFTLFCISCFWSHKLFKYNVYLVAGYYLNIVFQTYGYEFGNLILLALSANMYRQLAVQNLFKLGTASSEIYV